MKKILFIFLFLHTTVPSVIWANFPFSPEISVALFISGVISPLLYEDAKSVLNNSESYVNFMRHKINLTCGTIGLIGNGLKFLCLFQCIAGTLTGRYRTEFTSNGEMKYIPNLKNLSMTWAMQFIRDTGIHYLSGELK